MTKNTQSSQSSRHLITITWQIAQPFLRDRQGNLKYRSVFYFFGVILGVFLNVLSNVWFSYWMKSYSSCLNDRDEEAFYKFILQFVYVITASVPSHLFLCYLRGRLILSWTRDLTKELLDYYYHDKRYYRCATDFNDIDNIDQRIQEDSHLFTEKVVYITSSAVEAMFGLCSFSLILYTFSPLLCVIGVLYSGFASGAGVFIMGRRFTEIKRDLIRTAADFRYTLVRTRENIESIALYDGGMKENAIADQAFMIWLAVKFVNLRWHVAYRVFMQLYRRFVYFIPPLILAPGYFRGEIPMGTIPQASYAFRSILESLGFVVLELEDIADLQAQGSRLSRSLEILKCKLPESSIVINRVSLDTCTELLIFKNLSIHAPSVGNQESTVLVKNLSLSVTKSDRVMIKGTNGCGKSSILRVLGGLFTKGEGYVQAPHLEDLLFVPQNSYFTTGNLREQILYPEVDLKAEDKTLLHYLQLVNLEKLYKTYGFDEAKNWSAFLSNGEKQRLAFVRVLLRCHKKLVILDEATSALDPLMERRMYSILCTRAPYFVSISHRDTLLPFHTKLLSFSEQWELFDI